jgi:hypothetical protein
LNAAEPAGSQGGQERSDGGESEGSDGYHDVDPDRDAEPTDAVGAGVLPKERSCEQVAYHDSD